MTGVMRGRCSAKLGALKALGERLHDAAAVQHQGLCKRLAFSCENRGTSNGAKRNGRAGLSSRLHAQATEAALSDVQKRGCWWSYLR
jgi:hypothetical protein